MSNEAFEKWFEDSFKEITPDNFTGNSFQIGKSNMLFGWNAAKADSDKNEFKPDWVNYRQGVADGKADSEKEIAELKARLQDIATDWQVAQIHINTLRDALERAIGYIPAYTVNKKDFDLFQQALSKTPTQSLAEYRNAEIAELKVQNSTLREALVSSKDELLQVLLSTELEKPHFDGDDFHEVLNKCNEALSKTPAQHINYDVRVFTKDTLAEYRNSVIEECAGIVDTYPHDAYGCVEDCRDEIRALKSEVK